MSPNGVAAVEYVKGQDTPVFKVHYPIFENGTVACSCPQGPNCDKIGKHPATPRGFKDATTDVGVIEEWWERENWNIGTPTGWAFDSLDPDTPKANETLEKLCAETGTILDGPFQRTGRGHQYLVDVVGHNRDTDVPNLDFKGIGGYIVLPPSTHFTGRTYTWLRPMNGHFTALTDELIDKLWPPKFTQPASEPPFIPDSAKGSLDRYWRSILRIRMKELREVTACRNNALNAAAFRMGRIIALGAPEEFIKAHLMEAGWLLSAQGEHPFSERSIQATINSGIRAGKHQPDIWFQGG